jgi:hypothetical protein
MKIPNLKDLVGNSFMEEDGSAIIEFIILALPLFVPLAIFLTSVSQVSEIQLDARNFARQIARVYVTSPGQNLVSERIALLTQIYSDKTFSKDNISPNPEIGILCSQAPCLKPGGTIKVTVHLISIDSKFQASASATESVDAWRNAQ